MNRPHPRFLLLAVAVLSLSASAGAQVSDNFQSYALGTLPSPKWMDVGAVLPGLRVPSFPSGYVINTLDAHGNANQAVSTVGGLADSKGIFAFVPVSNQYSLFADVRIDQYSDQPFSTTTDYAMQLSFGQNGVFNWSGTPQAGIYASSFTKGWRLFATTASTSADIDLNVAALPGVWYTVAQSMDVLTGQFHSQIWDASSGTLLLDQFDTISGWVPADAQFDAFAFFGGELSADDTIGNIAVIDNVNITATTAPEPGTLGLMAFGSLFVGLARRRRIS